MFDKFMNRHIGVTNSSDLSEMLKVIGVESVEELISQVIPASIRLKKPLALPEGMSEYEFTSHITALAAKNQQLRSFIGMGYYPTAVPAVVSRNVFENPAWYTSYTPYQAEISQGRLEALLNYQTAILSLTGMQIANCSLLDEATAAAEAMLMMYALRSREAVKQGRNQIFVDKDIFPQTLDVLLTRSEPFGIELIVDSYSEYEFSGKEFGAIVQTPAANGEVRDYTAFAAKAHEAGALVAAIADILSLALLTPPAEWGADIAVGSTQRLGCPMGFGGPTAGYMATKEEYKRDMPGRIIGLSKDKYERPAYRLALQTREQHIKREKATSNICTAEALCAIMAGFYGVYHGAEGLRKIAETIHGKAVYLNEMLQAYGFTQENVEFFDTLKISGVEDVDALRCLALEKGINLYYAPEGWVGLSVDETMTLDDMNLLIELFAEISGNIPMYEESESVFEELWAIDENKVREVDYLKAEVFKMYHTETEMMRYIKRLERKDISLTHTMIPLGSCTMKLNPAAAMLPITFPGFMAVHPLAPENQVMGYKQILKELEDQLSIITGMAGCCLQPTSGAAGEYAGLVTIREYLKKIGQSNRNVLLIPASAHGTNPASCAQAGFVPVVVKCDEQGNTDIEDWQSKAEQHKDVLAGCMITYPSTHGIFEMAIRQMCSIVHDNGGQVYMDGANMNAQIAYTNPGYIGADVCHLNLHKSFASPHGGGGPGSGPVGVRKGLEEYLPNPQVKLKQDGTYALEYNPESLGAVSAFLGNYGVVIRAYAYLLTLGKENVPLAGKLSVLNANYIKECLKGYYKLPIDGLCKHEFVFDGLREEYGGDHHDAGHVTTLDVAKRLLDYGFHAPTIYFPLLFHEAMMIEPTETESKKTLDEFIEVMKKIAIEARDQREMLKTAPHDTPVRRLDDVKAVKEPKFTYKTL